MFDAASVVGAVELVAVVGAVAWSAVSELVAPNRNARIASTRMATAATAVAAAAQRQVFVLRPGDRVSPDSSGVGSAGGAAAGAGGSSRKPRDLGGGGFRMGRNGASAGGTGDGALKAGRAAGPRGAGGT